MPRDSQSCESNGNEVPELIEDTYTVLIYLSFEITLSLVSFRNLKPAVGCRIETGAPHAARGQRVGDLLSHAKRAMMSVSLVPHHI